MKLHIPAKGILRMDVEAPPECRGGWKECLQRTPSLTQAKWYRGQMRSWAGYWRRRRMIAAAIGESVQTVAQTHLELAIIYRNNALKLEKAGAQ